MVCRTVILPMIFLTILSWELLWIPQMLVRYPPPPRSPTLPSQTPAPTPAPTPPLPSTKANKRKPTTRAIKKPTKKAIRKPPTKASPTTDAPTDSPTKSPTTDAPTDSPTKSPTTDSPTDSPTKSPTTAAPVPSTEGKPDFLRDPLPVPTEGTQPAQSSASLNNNNNNNNCNEDPSKELVVRAIANYNDTCSIGGDGFNKDVSSLPCWMDIAEEGDEESPGVCMDHSIEDTAMKFIPSPGYPEEKLALIQGQGTVLMHNGHVLTPGGLMILRSGGCCLNFDTELPALNRPLPPDQTNEIADPSIVQNGVYEISHDHSARYYHFLAQSLPRLEYFIEELAKDGGVYSNMKIRVTGEAYGYDFVHEAIALMGISSDRVYATKEGGKKYTPWWIPDDDKSNNNPASGLVVVPPGVPTGSPKGTLYAESETARLASMARRMREKACKVTQTEDLFDKVYWERACDPSGEKNKEVESVNVLVINRGDGGFHARNIINHEELMSSLRTKFDYYFNHNQQTQAIGGSDGVATSSSGGRRLQENGAAAKETPLEFREFLKGSTTSSLAEDVVMFGGADIVVAPHGAGTTNLIFMEQQGGLIIELVCEGQGARVFDFMAMRLKHQFCAITEGMSWVGSEEYLEKRRKANPKQMNLPMKADLDVVMPQIMACVRKWWEKKNRQKGL